MKLLIPLEELGSKSARESVQCECENCHNPFNVNKNVVLRALKGQRKVKYCSRKCVNVARHNNALAKIHCKNCGREFEKPKNDLNENGNNFCDIHCSTNYLNRLKKKTHILMVKTCASCNQNYKTRNETSKYCSLKCQKTQITNQIIEDWINGKIIGHSGKALAIKKCIRKYLIEKSNFKCSKCSWGTPHPITGKSTLEINHIDGNASNSTPSNLEVLCPNCHSLTSNFRALNKNSQRQRNGAIGGIRTHG